MAGHDIVVLGASAGGVELLLDLVHELPARLPASLFVVVHTTPNFQSPLPELLSRRGPLEAVHPLHGDAIVPGRIYVAPPDTHLQVEPGFVQVVRGPKENGHRPAVDALFRTASRSYGPRVIGVILSGHQDCGTAGMLSVKARGGLTVVQDPATAIAREMPESAMHRVAVDHVVSPAELPDLLTDLVALPAAAPAADPPAELSALEGDRLGDGVDVVCPLCDGVLTEADVGAFRHFRCHEGHTFSLQRLAREQGDATERALWAAARSLDEGAAVSARLAVTSGPELRNRFAERAEIQRRNAEAIRKLLLQPEAPYIPAPGS
jgi:two-component system chemotaxis response regulator CheB